MVEPYQRGKIPLLFVHGLLSDPLTWVAQANAIRANPDVFEKYQLWAFEYATGEAFFVSAAKLRRQLREIRHDLDPQGQDAALDRMVIVGHSMGGLLAKLQVTSSHDVLWRSFAFRPFESLKMSPPIAQELRSAFFFQSSRSVSKVLFMEPHTKDLQLANRCIGRIGSALIEEPPKGPRSTLNWLKIIRIP